MFDGNGWGNSYPGYGNNYNGYGYNGAQGRMAQPRQDMAPRCRVVEVNGEGGANSYVIGPDSSALLLDEHDPIVWFVKTDGAGYKTVIPYTITPYQPVPPVDVRSLEERLKRLEDKINVQPDTADVK